MKLITGNDFKRRKNNKKIAPQEGTVNNKPQAHKFKASSARERGKPITKRSYYEGKRSVAASESKLLFATGTLERTGR